MTCVDTAQVSQYISAAALSGLLIAKKQLDPADLRELPPAAEIRMFLQVTRPVVQHTDAELTLTPTCNLLAPVLNVQLNWYAVCRLRWSRGKSQPLVIPAYERFVNARRRACRCLCAMC